ncbi:MAG: 2-oxoacid:ferredoxin oxidoreductase subunit beta [candidate division Zixibacteria bacterium]|nr:2-oxoacid:ferredoxin oxidoreductase subunit beta [candidate division Zixibacteria bacterium]
METLSKVTHQYLRTKKKFPNVWCAGCGIGIVLGTIIRAIDKLNLKRDSVAMVSGIGCSSRMPVYVDFNTLHTTHGRALAFATGVKLANQKLKVIVISGDGDGLSIGGNHFIHTCRRNIDITTILVNNSIYGMTGGQCSPTTPFMKRGTTAPYGNRERGFDICSLAKSAGATFVARGTVYHVTLLEKIIQQAILKKGFSLVEVISHCHTFYGRINKEGTAVKMMEWQRDHAVPIQAASKMTPDKLKDKFLIGVLWDVDFPEYCEEYDKVIAQFKTEPEVSK